MKLLKHNLKTPILSLLISICLGFSVNAQKIQPKLRLPIGHTGGVNTAQFSPDGKSIVTTSKDKTAKVWDVYTGKLLHSLEGHTFHVTSAQFSPDGKSIITASENAKIWDVASGNMLQDLTGHTWRVTSAHFSPDGKIVVTASDDNTAKIWDVASGKMLYDLTGHTRAIKSAKFSPDGKSIVTASDDKTAKVWDASTGKLLYSLEGHTHWVRLAAFSPDLQGGQRIVTASFDSTAKVWEASTGKLLHTLKHTGVVNSAEFSPDLFGEQRIVTASKDKTAKIWEASTGKLLHNLDGYSLSVNSASFSSNGQRIVTAFVHNKAKIWETSTGKLLHSLEGHTGWVNSASFSADRQRIVTASEDNTAKIWEASSGKTLHSLEGHSGIVTSAAFSPNVTGRQRIVTTSRDETAKVWEASNGKLLHSLEGHSSTVNSAAFSPDSIGRQRIVTASHDGTAKVWEASSGKLLHNLEGHKWEVYSAQFSPDGKSIVTASGDKTSKVWEASNGKLLHSLEGHSGIVTSAAFSPNVTGSQRIVTTSRDGTAKVWEASNGKLLHSLEGHSGTVSSVAFSTDGQRIVTTSHDSTAKIWEVSTGKLLHSLEEHTYWVNSAAFSADGKKIVTASRDRTAKLWEVSTGKLLHSLEGHRNFIISAVFSPDGQKIVTTSDGTVTTSYGTAKVWEVSTGELIKDIASNGKCDDINFKSNTLISRKNSMLSLWDMENGEEIYSWIAIDSKDYLVFLPNKYYRGTNNGVSKLHYVLENLQTIGFDQLDIKYNRPDKVLTALGEVFGNPDTGLINAYYHAWQKRVQKLNIDTTSFEEGFSVPKSDFKNREQIEYEQNGKQLTLQVWGKDSEYLLDRYNIWVNEVPVFGKQGINIRDKTLSELDTTVTITLSEGDNKIETSVHNVNGIESYRIPLYVRYNPHQPNTEKLYFIGIGVDRYRQPGHDLKYSAKDIRDLAKQLKTIYGNNIKIDTLFDEQVTYESILNLKEKLLQTTVNDKVIVSFSGHGLLDRHYDYYLATHTIDFSNPSVNGLPYEDLEWLLDSIPARKKLLLIDACHSGEVDKEELMAMNTAKPEDTKGVGLLYEYKPTIGMENSFELMQEMFANVNRGTGATIISAAGGTQYAYEKGKLGNGVFTYSILELMEQQKEIKVSDLKAKVGERVVELTNGLQKPTSRNETIEFDWKVW